MSLEKRDHAVLWHPFTQYGTEDDLIAVERAEGVWLFTRDGKKFMDVNGSWWVNIHGHCHPYITQLLNNQLQKLHHVIFAGVTHEPAVKLGELLTERAPEGLKRVFYSDNGSTAVEVALKMAIQYFFNRGEKRKRFLAFEGAYHGDTFGAMSVGQRGGFNVPFETLFFEVDFLPLPNEENLHEVMKSLRKLLAAHQYAGFVYEPLIQGAAGMRMYNVGHLDLVLSAMREHGALLIADEVFTGFGRTGAWFASQHCVASPDLMCLSKGLTAGVLPLGVTMSTESIFNTFVDNDKARAFLHGHSFTANPLACTAAIASIQLLDRQECWQSIRMISAAHQSFIEEAYIKEVKKEAVISQAAAMGTVLRLELQTNERSGYYNSTRSMTYAWFMKKGLLIRPLGNILYVNPPYCISREELETVYMAIREYLIIHSQSHRTSL